MFDVFESLAATKSAPIPTRSTSTILGVFCKQNITGITKTTSGRIHIIGAYTGTPSTPTYATSDNEGATWTFRAPILTTLNWNAICSTGTTVYILSDTGLIAKSTDDGETWTVSSTATAGTSAATCLKIYNGVIFAIVDTKVKYSTDNGATWVVTPSFDALNTKGRTLAYNGTTLAVFCAVTAGTNKLFTSSNLGATWTTSVFSTGGRKYFDCAPNSNGTRWVVVGGVGNIATSTDLVNWTVKLNQDATFKGATPNGDFQCVVWDGSNWIVISDGNWTAVLDADCTSKTAWTMLPNNRRDTPGGLTQLINVNGTLYGSGGSGVVLKTTDHINWQNITTSTGIQPIASLATNGTRWVGITKNISGYDPLDFGRIVISAENDNQTWSKIAYESSDNIDFNCVVYGNAGFVAVNGAGRASKSVDGINWTESATGTTESLLKVIYDGTRYVAVSANNICVSTDGINWTLSTIPNRTGNQTSIAYGDYKYVVITSAGKSYYSTNLTTWTEGTMTYVSGFKDIATNGHIWLAVGGASGIANRSYDGITWAASGLTGTYPCDKIYFIDDSFITIYSGLSYKSTDGTTWSQITLVNYGLMGIYSIGYQRSGDGAINLVAGVGAGNIAVVRTNPLKF